MSARYQLTPKVGSKAKVQGDMCVGIEFITAAQARQIQVLLLRLMPCISDTTHICGLYAPDWPLLDLFWVHWPERERERACIQNRHGPPAAHVSLTETC